MMRWVAMVAVVAAAQPVTASDWKLEAGVSARETYSDNVALSSGGKQGDFITEVNPYISASKKGARLEADFHYTMNNVFYADQNTSNRTYHQLNARGKAELWEQEVFLDANAYITQQTTDLLGPIGIDNTSATNNLTNVGSITLSPYWQHRFGTTANLLARYSHSEVIYGGNDFTDSTVDSVYLGLASGSAFRDLFWRLNYSDQQIDYNYRPDVTFATTSATLGYVISPKLRVNGTVGYQDNSYAGSLTPLSGSIWNVGFTWAPTNRTDLTLGYGDILVGNAYNLDFRHRTPHTTWSASYAETLSTSSTQFSGYQLGVGLSGGLLLQVPGTVLSSGVFLDKRFQAAVGYTKGKSTLRLSLYDTSQESVQSSDFIATGGITFDPFLQSATIKQRGGNLDWNWRLSPVVTSNVGTGIGRYNYVDLGRRDSYGYVQAGLSRTFNADLRGSIFVRHYERSSNQSGNDSTENRITGTVNYKF
jgi:hypothetical protein